ncbi:MAG: restriction endonuclease [Mycobacteriaceae bacterium]|nr:restriction endonuclease [Mycobacteriaceae bacterium]
MPTHQELVVPILRALVTLGDSAKSRDVIEEVVSSLPDSDRLLQMTYPNRPNTSVLEDRVGWSIATSKRIGATDQPTRGMYMVTDFGRSLLLLDANSALEKVKEIDREIYREQRQEREKKNKEIDPEIPQDSDVIIDTGAEDPVPVQPDWEEQLLARLHSLSPDGFEKFVIYLLKKYGLKLMHVGGTGDEGIDAIGTAPLSPVLSSRVAVQVKRYAPDGKPIGRETVALFQRDAATKGAERAILVTLSRFTEPARKAATNATPTVDLIDGKKLAELILEDGESGVSMAPVVDDNWFNRFD